jgi:hypothetical protein
MWSRGSYWIKASIDTPCTRPRHGCGSDIPELRPAVLTSVFQLLLLTYYAHQSSRIWKLPPAIETADVIEPGAAALWPTGVPMSAENRYARIHFAQVMVSSQSRLKSALHQLLEFFSRSCRLGLYGSGWYTQNLRGFPDGKTAHITELEGPKHSRRQVRHQSVHNFVIPPPVRSRACQPL